MTLLNRIARVASLAAVVALIPSASFADGVNRRPTAVQGERQVQLSDDVAAIRLELVRTQRTIREALLQASLTTVQLNEAFGLVESFTRNYTQAVEIDDPMLSEFTLDELFEAKIAAPLQAQFGLRSGETDFLRGQLDQWITGELVVRESLRVRGDLTGGAR